MAQSSAPTIDRWGGGVSPFSVSWQKMMMWWFIVGDGVLFAGFLAGYGGLPPSYKGTLNDLWLPSGSVRFLSRPWAS